jgi:hypothetical protein
MGWKAAIRIARTSLARSSPPHGSYQAPESLLLRRPLLWRRLVRPYRLTTPNGKMIARLRTYFTQPETLVFPLAPTPMGKGFAGVLHSIIADLSGRASVLPTIPRKIAILSRMRDY